ncbi:MAG: DUF4167 domain-containing protein [Alphaproteobacteria bacterium]|nr:DUF4167 domain-containing protein [Alphaproteobacteria bacterium]
MKKNNKFRNNGNSNAYSLNYKFDSISPAGKVSGTALDLIKKYNELAKEAHGTGDYIEMEVYRQYAEHYRKIVTEINERKNLRLEQQNSSEQTIKQSESVENAETPVTENTESQVEPIVQTPMPIRKKTFKIVEIKETNTELVQEETSVIKEETIKPKRVIRRKKIETEDIKNQSEAV